MPSQEWKVPFHACMPCFLYEEEEGNPNFLRFKECRNVKIPRSYLVQLDQNSFRSLARAPDHFSSKVHHCVFLFVGVSMVHENGDRDRRKKVRAFKLGSDMVLKEETDNGIVCKAWEDFQKSPASRHVVDLAEDFSDEFRGEQGIGSVFQMRRELKTRVVIQTWGALSYYKANATAGPCDDDEYAGLRDRFGVPYSTGLFVPWGSVHGGRLCFQHVCNVASGCVEIPLLMPSREILEATVATTPGAHRCQPQIAAASGSNRRPRTVAGAAERPILLGTLPMVPVAAAVAALPPLPHICPVMESIKRNPIMPGDWYRKNIVGARLFSIEFYKHKSVMVCEMLDGKIFRFKECFPDRPISKQERKGVTRSWKADAGHNGRDDCCEEHGGEGDAVGGEIYVDESIHDDCVSSPAMELAHVLRWKAELSNIEMVLG